MFSREEILSKKRVPAEHLDVPAWGGRVWFTPMSGLDSASIPAGKDMTDSTAMAHVLVRTVTNEKGERVFRDEDAAAIAQQSYADLKKPYEIAWRINGLDSEEAEKNSEAAPVI